MTPLDQTIISIAIRDAKRFLREGFSTSEAVMLATPGAWAQFRPRVIEALTAESLFEDRGNVDPSCFRIGTAQHC